MSKQNNLTDFLTDVADAIRAKKGSTDLINPQNFSAEIAALSGGLEIVDMAETTATIEPNKVYVWGMVESLNITLGASTNESDFFAFRFRCSKPTMTSVTVNGATWADDTELDAQGKPILDLGSWYQCEIKGGTSVLYARLAHYIHFADPKVETVLLANGIGDGLGVTYKDAAKVTDIATWFIGNSDITSFLELVYFRGINVIKGNAFKGCTALTQIALPAPVTDIGISSFNGCILLTNVVLPESILSIYNTAFRDCTSLVEISLPASLTTILNAAFKGCSSLKSVYGFKNTQVTSIKDETFNDCSSLAEIALPASLTSIGNYAFGGCSALAKIDLASTQVTSVGNGAFYRCTSLAEIVFPATLTSIGQSALNGCTSLAEIALPASITSIGNYVFQYCTKLKTMTVNANTPPALGSGAIPTSIVAIYVPDESVAAYQAATNWSDFASKIKGISEMPAK